MNEWDFTAKVVSWVDGLINAHADSPFKEARTEQRASEYSADRRDFTLIGHAGKPVLTGEFKLPDKADGATPYNPVVVDGARAKARAAGVKFFLTWNVNDAVLWETEPQASATVGTRQDYKNWHVLPVPIRRSTQLELDETKRLIQKWLAEEFLPSVAAALRGEDVIERKAPDEKFIDAFEAAMRQPVALTIEELTQRYNRPASRKELDPWLTSELGFTISDDPETRRDNLEKAARHACYTLATRLIFYEALLKRYAAELERLDAPPHLDTPDALRRHFQQLFERAREVTGDYETVFGTSPKAIGNHIPFYNVTAVPFWRSFVGEIHAFDFTRLDYDVLGNLFERLISPEERHKFGQYYTSAAVVDLLLAFAMPTGRETVMDPACGGGTFLVRAYARKQEFDPARTHAQRLADLYGVDVSPYAVNLTTINLATRELERDENYPRVARSDFFAVQPRHAFMRLPHNLHSGGLGTGQTRPVEIPALDAVVGNPPYVRQEDIGDKAGYAKLVASEGLTLSQRADLHAYFWPHSTAFLKPTGYLCFITSSQWLDVDYGFALQKWILHHFEVVAICESIAEPWFVGARVVTTATILRRQPDEAARAANLVRFVQFQQPLSTLMEPAGTSIADALNVADSLRDELLALTADTPETPDASYRARLVPQAHLWAEGQAMGALLPGKPKPGTPRYAGKWGRYLRAPNLWFELTARAKGRLVPLAELARIRFGVKSGKDEFFLPKDATAEALAKHQDAREFALAYHGVDRAAVAAGQIRIVACGPKLQERRPIEARYLQPEVHNLKDVKRLSVNTEDCARVIILIPTPTPVGTLAAQYVAWGESQGWNSSSTCAQRATTDRGWYDLRGHKRGALFWPMAQQYRHAVPRNPHDLICNHNLFDLHPAEGIDADVLAGVLNSSWTVLSKFQYGRPVGNEGNLKTEVVDVNLMLVADPRQGTPRARQRVAAAFQAMQGRTQLRFLSDRQFQLTAYQLKGKGHDLNRLSDESELDQADRHELDDAVLELLGLELATDRQALRAQLYEYLRDFFVRTRRKEEQANQNKKKAGGKKRVTAQSLAQDVLAALRETNPALLAGYDELFNGRHRGQPYDTYDLESPGDPRITADAFNDNAVIFWQGKRRRHIIATRHAAQQQLVHLVAQHGRRQLTRFPLSEDASQALSKKFAEHRRARREAIEALVAERTQDAKLQLATVEQVQRLLPV